jgi:hypothetical protein
MAAKKKKKTAAKKASVKKTAAKKSATKRPGKPEHDLLDVTVTLTDAKPKVWRRFLIANTATFFEIHEAIQAACGWESRHGWAFRDPTGNVDLAGVYDDEMPDATREKIKEQIGAIKAARFVYKYDFGDCWMHDVAVKKTKETSKLFRKLVDGARAFPLEDCGGIDGYERCVDFVKTGEDPYDDVAELKKIVGKWKPDEFKYATVAKKFDRA